MQQKFTFSTSYCGVIHMKRDNLTGKMWASSILVSLAAMQTSINDDDGTTPIKDDSDAIKSVSYTLSHEWMHYALRKINHNDSLEQEKMIYASIGNGGNNYAQVFYKFPKNPEWERRVKDHI